MDQILFWRIFLLGGILTFLGVMGIFTLIFLVLWGFLLLSCLLHQQEEKEYLISL